MTRGRYLGWLGLVLAVFWSRFLTCVEVSELAPRSLDPHGFGLFSGFLVAAAQTIPFCWLLLGGRRADIDTPVRTTAAQDAALILVIGSPTMLQLSYLRGLSIDTATPVILSSIAWMTLVAGLAVHRRPGVPSPHRAFAASPKLAWAVVVMTGLPVLALASG